LHLGQVDDETTIAGSVAGDVVATTTDRHQQVVATGKTDRGDDIGHASAAHDHGRMAVNHPIPHLPGVFVTAITGAQERATQARFEIVDRRFLEDGVLEARAHCCDHVQVCHHTSPREEVWFPTVPSGPAVLLMDNPSATHRNYPHQFGGAASCAQH